MKTPLTFREVFAQLEQGSLTPDQMRAAFETLFEGAWNPVQIGAFAAALRLRGLTNDMLVAAARALCSVMNEVRHGLPCVLDTCGTGGDGAHTLNISTAAAVVVAASGVYVAKHGNRSVSSRCGSADVLEALGITTSVPPEKQALVLSEARIAFLMAPAHHPALAHAATARRDLGLRTIFNALGPLVNPARATHQLMGVYDDALRPIAAQALGELGVTGAWVVHSEDGLDELSPAGPTRVSVLRDGRVDERVVHPEDFGLAPTPLNVLAGGDAVDNAEHIRRILAGENHPATTAVVLNAAAALVVAEALSPRDGAARATEAIASGRARATLTAWIESSRRHGSAA
jgi:anthranilate phosphoribosyltransferase